MTSAIIHLLLCCKHKEDVIMYNTLSDFVYVLDRSIVTDL